MFVIGILLGMTVCVILLAGFILEVMDVDARDVYEHFDEEKEQ